MISLVDSRCVCSGIYHLRLVGQEREHVIIRCSNRLSIVLTMLGSNQNYAIGTLVTIESRCGCILQDRYALHILCYHILNGTLYAIHDEERSAAAG